MDPVATFGRLSPRLFRLGNDLRLALVGRLGGGIVGHGPRGRAQVALTFDDGPDPRWTPQILAALEHAQAQATFFVLGKALTEHADLGVEIAARHQIGTHLFSHGRELASDSGAMLEDLERALAVHRDVLGQTPTALRFPFGKSGKVGGADVRAYGLTAYHWSFSSHDSRAHSPDRIIARVASLVGPGDIVLLHDGVGPGSRLGPGHRDNTVAALPELLAELQRRGLEAVTLDQMFAVK